MNSDFSKALTKKFAVPFFLCVVVSPFDYRRRSNPPIQKRNHRVTHFPADNDQMLWDHLADLVYGKENEKRNGNTKPDQYI